MDQESDDKLLNAKDRQSVSVTHLKLNIQYPPRRPSQSQSPRSYLIQKEGHIFYTLFSPVFKDLSDLMSALYRYYLNRLLYLGEKGTTDGTNVTKKDFPFKFNLEMDGTAGFSIARSVAVVDLLTKPYFFELYR